LTLGQDICNRDHLEKVFREHKVSKVIHLAAVANLNFFHKCPELARKINIDGTHNVVEIAKKYGASVLFASTCCAYGNNGCHPSNEESPLCPTEAYAQSKADMEPVVIGADPRNVVARLATFDGPRAPAKFAHCFIRPCIGWKMEAFLQAKSLNRI
jgi:dTDP-4-dehydrorhamnose reductase